MVLHNQTITVLEFLRQSRCQYLIITFYINTESTKEGTQRQVAFYQIKCFSVWENFLLCKI